MIEQNEFNLTLYTESTDIMSEGPSIKKFCPDLVIFIYDMMFIFITSVWRHKVNPKIVEAFCSC